VVSLWRGLSSPAARKLLTRALLVSGLVARTGKGTGVKNPQGEQRISFFKRSLKDSLDYQTT
jgi:hypothetical protein